MENPTYDFKEDTAIRGIRLGRIAGVGLHLDWSWLAMLLLILWNVAGFVVPQASPGGNVILYISLGIAASVLFLLAILAHELAHALMARSEGVPVRRIILYIFGGVTRMEHEPRTAGEEFRIAIVGPLVSLFLGLLFVFVGYGGRMPPLNAFIDPQYSSPQMGPVLAVFQWLGPVNILIGMFNLLPGFPLDGGRVLRSILWARTKNLRVATRLTIMAGQGVAGILLGLGAAMAMGFKLPLLGDGLMNGLWLAFIGWFLLTSVTRAEPEEQAQENLEGVLVESFMRKNIPTASPGMPISVFINDRVMKSGEPAFPVIYHDKLVGLISLEEVREVPREKWDTMRVAEVMTTRNHLTVISPRADAMGALHRMANRKIQQLPVVEDGRLVGMLIFADLINWMNAQAKKTTPGEALNPDLRRE